MTWRALLLGLPFLRSAVANIRLATAVYAHGLCRLTQARHGRARSHFVFRSTHSRHDSVGLLRFCLGLDRFSPFSSIIVGLVAVLDDGGVCELASKLLVEPFKVSLWPASPEAWPALYAVRLSVSCISRSNLWVLYGSGRNLLHRYTRRARVAHAFLSLIVLRILRPLTMQRAAAMRDGRAGRPAGMIY